MDANPIDPAMDRMSVAPGEENTERKSPTLAGDAGTDESIVQRLYKNPESKEARLDRALDESMDASDPPSTTQPIHSHSSDLPESSGYDAKAEKKLAAGDQPGLLGRIGKALGIS